MGVSQDVPTNRLQAQSHTRRPENTMGHVLWANRRVCLAGENKSEAGKVLAQLMEQSKKQYVSPFYVAIVYAGLSENDKAIDWLEGNKDRSNAIVFSKVDHN